MVGFALRLAVEAAVGLVAALGAFFLGTMRFNRFSSLQRLWRACGRSHPTAVLLTFLASLVIGVTLNAIRLPVPSVHDEFSYMLAADTFRHGRLTNPAHPMWVHFESFHIIQQPTYASKYPPAQGIALALGWLLTGYPAFGACLSTAIAAAAVCWMLQAVMSGRWALLGGLLVVCHPSIQLYWGQNYWGGAIAMLGGALMFGALPRLLRRPGPTNATILAVGVALLANSRPYEGFVASLPVALVLFVHLIRTARSEWKANIVKMVLPTSAVLLAAAAFMAYYNFRTTHNPLKMPYQVDAETYVASPLFLWQPVPPVPEYRHLVMREFHTGYGLIGYQNQSSLSGLVEWKGKILLAIAIFFLPEGMMLAFGVGVWPHKKAWQRFGIATFGFCIAASCVVPWLQPHYLAPLVPLMFGLSVFGLRRLSCWKWPVKRFGRSFVVVLLGIYVSFFASRVWSHATRQPSGWQWDRSRIVELLEHTPGKHLIVVRYEPNHDGLNEWVYNEADIDQAKTVWAREMDPVQNQRLLEYFKHRRVWLLEADGLPPRLIGHQRNDQEATQR
jgi:hypothetical protein